MSRTGGDARGQEGKQLALLLQLTLKKKINSIRYLQSRFEKTGVMAGSHGTFTHNDKFVFVCSHPNLPFSQHESTQNTSHERA